MIGLTTPRPYRNARRAYWALVIGTIVFTLYGSFVPFQTHSRSWEDILGGWDWVLAHRWSIASRSDFVANVILGYPLGFSLLGAVCCGRVRWPKTLMVAAGLLPCCIAFSTGIEFLQLYFPDRTSSLSDVYAQALGAILGMGTWMVIGPWITSRGTSAWHGPYFGTPVAHWFLGYAFLVLLVFQLPLDLSISPASIFRKLRDDVVYIPFTEWGRLEPNAHAHRVQVWLELAGVYLILGLFAQGWSRLHPAIPKLPLKHQILLAFLVPSIMEGLQVFVGARQPSMTDVMLGGVSIIMGWNLGKYLLSRSLNLQLAVVLLQVWMAYLIAIGWMPFAFDRGIIASQFDKVEWIPFVQAYEKNYLHSLEEALLRVMLSMPLGALVAAVGGVPSRARVLGAMLLGGCLGFIIEAGQLFLPTRYPNPTELLHLSFGAGVAAYAMRQMRAYAHQLTIWR